MNQEQIDVSVIIGFKDWGVERLSLSIKSLLESFGNLKGEVIVSDFGSETFAPGELQEYVESFGAKYLRTETDEVWSRSRAVNAGYTASNGTVVVATDADMLFTPRSMELISEAVLKDPTTAVVLQCRDLPEGYDHNHLSSTQLSFQELHRVSQIRPRWGMGGMFAAHRDVIASVGGYDNRMHTYGGEDLDLAVRVRRSGRRIRWIENDQVRMYHIWHEPTIKSVEQDEAGAQAVQANRNILRKDPTWKRNTSASHLMEHNISWSQKAVSVVTPEVGLPTHSGAAFTLIAPQEIKTRLDLDELAARQLNVQNRARVGQVVAFKAPKTRTTQNWEIDFRLPVLVFDSRFTPIVAPYFQNGRWDILGAARRLQASRVDISPSSEVCGILSLTGDMTNSAAERDWIWSSAAGLFPKKPGPRGIRELVKNLPIEVLAGISSTVDILVSATASDLRNEFKPLLDIATEWTWQKNVLNGEGSFEAIIINASETDVNVICGMASSIDLSYSQIPFSEALASLERLSTRDPAIEVIEGARESRASDTAAIQVSWIENPHKFDDASLAEARTIGGDFIEIQTGKRHTVVWIAPHPLMDVEGNVAASLADSSFFKKWNTGIVGPIPIESLMALSGRL